MVPWSHWRQPFSGWMMTVLTSELTHFYLVIHLSKLQQLALPFSGLLGLSRWSVGPGSSPKMPVYRSDAVLTFLKPRFLLQFLLSQWQITHDMTWTTGRHTTFRCGLFSFWLSGGVKHIVHLIRWNLKAVLCPCGWTGNTGLEWHNARTLGLGAESCCLTNCFGFLVCHQLVPHLVPNFPRVLLRNVSWGLGVCAVLSGVCV